MYGCVVKMVEKVVLMVVSEVVLVVKGLFTDYVSQKWGA